MKCSFCKRDEIEIKTLFSPLFKKLEKDMLDIDERGKNKELDYIKEHSIFSKESKEKAKSINENLMDMKLEYIKEKYNILLALDENLEILMKYLEEYSPSSGAGTMRVLTELFAEEPTKERLYPIVKDILERKGKIKGYIEQIQSKIAFQKVEDETRECILEFEEEMMLNIFSEKQYYFEFKKIYKQTICISVRFVCICLIVENLLGKLNSKKLEREANSLKGRYDYIPEVDNGL